MLDPSSPFTKLFELSCNYLGLMADLTEEGYLGRSNCALTNDLPAPESINAAEPTNNTRTRSCDVRSCRQQFSADSLHTQLCKAIAH
jgi:hypothetical protein